MPTWTVADAPPAALMVTWQNALAVAILLASGVHATVHDDAVAEVMDARPGAVQLSASVNAPT
jgi:hypothetical protein